MTPDYEAWTFWGDLAQWALTVVIGLYAWITSRQRATQAQIGELQTATDKRLTTHAERLVKLEEQVRHLPEDSEIRELTDRVAEIHGDLKALTAKLDGLSAITEIMRDQVKIMDEFLRQRSSDGR